MTQSQASVPGEESAPPPGARTERGARTRARLLEAAEKVFTELGYHDASIVKIAEAAGVANGTFYLHFTGKQEIFDELVDDLNRRVRQAMAESATRGRTRAESERLGFEGFFRFTAEHPGLYRVIRQAEFASPPALRRHYERIADGYAQGLQAAMDRGEIAQGDPQVLAWALMGAGELIGLRWILWGDGDEIPAHVFEEAMRFLLRGLGASDD
jgi:AcrR family transcriptional regulator